MYKLNCCFCYSEKISLFMQTSQFRLDLTILPLIFICYLLPSPTLTHHHNYSDQKFCAMFEYHNTQDIHHHLNHLLCLDGKFYCTPLMVNLVPFLWMSWLHPCRKFAEAPLAVAALTEKMSSGYDGIYSASVSVVFTLCPSLSFRQTPTSPLLNVTRLILVLSANSME